MVLPHHQKPTIKPTYIVTLFFGDSKLERNDLDWLKKEKVSLRLSPAASPKFRSLKEYSLSFTEHSKRFCPLNILSLQQRPPNSVP
jgi:hypothetical protein